MRVTKEESDNFSKVSLEESVKGTREKGSMAESEKRKR